MVNKFHFIQGGSETYYFALKRLLEKHGHTVIDFSMTDERNFPSPYSAYFVDRRDYHAPSSLPRQAMLARDFLYCREAKTKLDRLIRDTRPDAVHLHLFHHQLSPSILDVLRKRDLPTLYTAHDLQMLCPNYLMLQKGAPCEACLHGQVFSCVRHRCVMGSVLKSALSALEHKIHWLRNAYAAIHCWIMPSDFYRRLFLKAGFPEEKLVFIPNFLDQPPLSPADLNAPMPALLYAGRLSREKGLMTLLNAISGTDIPLRIAGTGPLEAEIRERLQTPALRSVRLLGFLDSASLLSELQAARGVVLPSEWYENCPYSGIEALRMGRPLIGTSIGGIPELLHGNGFLTAPGKEADLRRSLTAMMNASPEEWRKMALSSLQLFSARFTAEAHWTKLRSAYARLGLSL